MTLDRPEQLLVMLVLEAVVGYPQAIYRRIGHPVAWFGALITRVESRWNLRGARLDRLRGFGLLLLLVGAQTVCDTLVVWCIQLAVEGNRWNKRRQKAWTAMRGEPIRRWPRTCVDLWRRRGRGA